MAPTSLRCLKNFTFPKMVSLSFKFNVSAPKCSRIGLVFFFQFKEWCFHHFFRPGLSHDDSLGFMAGFRRSGTLRGGTPPATPLLPFNLCLEDLPVFLAYESGAFSLCLLVSKVGSRGYKKRSLLLKRKEMWSVTISLQ